MAKSEHGSIIDTFLAELSSRERVDAAFIANYRALTEEFLQIPTQLHRPLEEIGNAEVERYIAMREASGEDSARTTEARTAARAFVQFIREGGLERARAKPSEPTDAALFSEDALALMREDLRRVWSTEGAGFALAVTAPLVLVVFGGTLALFGYVVHVASLAGAYFYALDHVVSGQPGLPKGASEHLGRSLWRGIMVTLVVALPAFLTNIYLDSAGVGDLGVGLGTLVAALIGAALVPAAALAVHASDSGLAAIMPHLWVRIIQRIPRPYARVAALYVVVIIALRLWAALVGLALGSLPTLAALVYSPLACLLVLAMATGLGGVIERNRFALGL